MDYDKRISMDTCNFHPFFFSRKTSGFINGGKIPFKNRDVFDMSFSLSFADKKYPLFKEWEVKKPIKKLGELANIEDLIKNMLALDYAINGEHMFKKPGFFAKKTKPDMALVSALK